MNVLFTVDFIINVNGEWNAVVSEVNSLSLNNFELRIQRLFFQCDILESCQRFTDFLGVVAVLVSFGLILSLVS